MTDEKLDTASEQHHIDRISILETRVDALIDAREKKSGSLIKDPTQLIAIAAFIISIFTTIISGYRTYNQDSNQLKSDLRATLLQLNTNYLSGT